MSPCLLHPSSPINWLSFATALLFGSHNHCMARRRRRSSTELLQQPALPAEWSLEQHTSSGLLAQVRASAVSLLQAEARVLDFARQHAPPNTLVMAGNSIGMDKRFIDKYMPELSDYLRHQVLVWQEAR